MLISAVIDSDDKATDKSKIRQKDTAAGQNVIDKTEGKNSTEESSKKYITKLTTFCLTNDISNVNLGRKWITYNQYIYIK